MSCSPSRAAGRLSLEVYVDEMKRLLAVLITAAVLAMGAPSAQAGERTPTTTDLRVMPSGTVAHTGDPIRMCVQATVSTSSESRVKVILEKRVAKAGATWEPMLIRRWMPNTTHCLIGVIATAGDNPHDIRLRARSLQDPTYARSSSQVVTVEVDR